MGTAGKRSRVSRAPLPWDTTDPLSRSAGTA